jgi:hypothetical protein
MFFRIASFELFIERAPQYAITEVDHVNHGDIGPEVWALGRHLVISRKQRRAAR